MPDFINAVHAVVAYLDDITDEDDPPVAMLSLLANLSRDVHGFLETVKINEFSDDEKEALELILTSLEKLTSYHDQEPNEANVDAIANIAYKLRTYLKSADAKALNGELPMDTSHIEDWVSEYDEHLNEKHKERFTKALSN